MEQGTVAGATAGGAEQATVQAVLDRYVVYADVMGRERDRKNPGDSDEHPIYKEAGYSLSWFFKYLAAPEKLNTISRAFLGDKRAQDQLVFGDLDEGAFAGDLLESAFPLNTTQRRAISRALASDVSLVQGPPGTGKTEVILNMASCIIGRNMTVAVIANNGKAIDNITEKIDAWRAASGDLEPNRQRLADAYAALGSAKKRKEWAAAHEGEPESCRFDAGRKVLDAGKLVSYAWEGKVRASAFLKRHPFITSTIHSVKKCFADGDAYQFDYVIMDEASQCNPLLGLVAMSCAKHLVLVGDVEQLPPIYSEDAALEIRREVEGRGLTMLDDPRFSLKDAESGSGASILGAIRRALEGYPVPNTFLEEHYRCHPGIIGFCNQFVYQPDGNTLKVKTLSYDREVACPIRVSWFEGNYCERYLPKGAAQTRPHKLSRRNGRQIEVFMREEWPQLAERLQRKPKTSVCVLSPYRGVLDELAERLASLGEGLEASEMGIECAGGADPTVPEIPMFTIHKSQGQEFDIVYLLPGEDGAWEWPWTEAKPLINVAVSRAKRELVIICSTALMSEGTQAALVGERRVLGARENMRDELTEEERAARGERERFLQKLLDYTRSCNEPVEAPAGALGFPESTYAFGFHRTHMRSVFDSSPFLRMELQKKSSSYELAVEGMLRGVRDRRDLACAFGVSIASMVSAQQLEDAWHALPSSLRPEFSLEEMEAFRCERGAHFDVILFDRASRELLLAIEIDGGQHRAPMGEFEKDTIDALYRSFELQLRRDRIKDAIVRTLGGRVLADNTRASLDAAGIEVMAPTLLRLPTDGTCAYEFDELKAADAGAFGLDDFVTVEELLDQAVPCGMVVSDEVEEGAGAQRHLLALSRLLASWKAADDADAALFEGLKANEANRILAEAGLLSGDTGSWCVTDAGAAAGIVASREWMDNTRKGASMQTVIRYAPESYARVKRVLVEGLRGEA